jgi:hypothetical protein
MLIKILQKYETKQMVPLLVFWTLSIVQSLFKKQRFGDWVLSPSSGKSLLSWAQSTELVYLRTPESESQSRCDRRSVGQSVLVSSPIWALSGAHDQKLIKDTRVKTKQNI